MIVSATAAAAADGVTYLESILDALKFLPVDLQRSMQLIHQLDAHAERTPNEPLLEFEIFSKSIVDKMTVCFLTGLLTMFQYYEKKSKINVLLS